MTCKDIPYRKPDIHMHDVDCELEIWLPEMVECFTDEDGDKTYSEIKLVGNRLHWGEKDNPTKNSKEIYWKGYDDPESDIIFKGVSDKVIDWFVEQELLGGQE